MKQSHTVLAGGNQYNTIPPTCQAAHFLVLLRMCYNTPLIWDWR